MQNLRYNFLSGLLLFVIFISGILQAHAKLTFCFKGRQELLASNHESQVSLASSLPTSAIECAGGLLFNYPFTLKALTAENNSFCVKSSVCDDSWQCGSQKQSITVQVIKLGKPPENESWTLFENDANISTDESECQASGLLWIPQQRPPTSPMMRRSKREITGLVPSERTSNEQLQGEIDDQTKRMFYYLTGINQDQVNSHLRVVKLYKMSTQLVSMICDPTFINPKFLTEIEKGFLFLLKEQGFDKLVDLDLDSYNMLKTFLENCATNVTMVKFLGSACPTGTTIQNVYILEGPEGRIKGIPYAPNEKTFKWGEYDIVLDAAWSVMNIVHGGCFEFFSRNVNLHHKFQVALEQLFHAALYLRWEHPTQLSDETFYDSIFMARVNDTMKAMDACIRYLYLLTPFKVQLNRPIHETFYRRKKRSAADDPLESSDSSSEENFLDTEEKIASNRKRIQTSGFLEDHKNHVQVASCLQSEKEMRDELEFRKESSLCS